MYSLTPVRALRAMVVLALTAGFATYLPAAEAATPTADTATAVAAKPYMGWSSWSMQSSKYPGLNPDGDYSYLTEANVTKQTDALASKLKKYGYDHINIDAGWWRDNSWTPEFDQYGRQAADPKRFPSGMKAVADRIHSKGLKAGIYLPAGLEKEAYNSGKTPIWNAEGCTTADVVYSDLRTTNGWDSSYKLDFSRPCTQKYIDSQAQLIADWKKYSNGWRIDTDVECYCNTLVTWENSVDDRWDDTPAWTSLAGPGGWNDLDSLDVGNGAMDGLTKAERQSYATLWAVAKSPLFTGDDLTKLDDYGVSLLTNREVIAVDQSDAPPARPVTPSDAQQVWAAKNPNGTYTVALFNLSDAPAAVSANWTTLGFTGKAAVRDLWNHEDLGTYTNKVTQALPAHGSRLFTITPRGSAVTLTGYEAEAATNTLSGNANIADCSACSGGKKVGNLYVGGKLTVNNVVAAKAGTYQVKIAYVSGDSRSVSVSSNGNGATSHKFPSTGDWGTVGTVSVPVTLKAGANTITFDSGSGYAPDIDRIDVPNSSS